MNKSKVHFAYTVPLARSRFRRLIDKLALKTKISPLYRNARDIFIPWQKPVRSPHCITKHLLQAFKKNRDIKLYNMYEKIRPKMLPEDVFLGQAVPTGGFSDERSGTDEKESVTSRSIRENKANRNFLIMPYTHDPKYVLWTKDLVRDLSENPQNGLIMVGGKIWERDWQEKSPYADINIPRKIHVEMGIDAGDYPVVKKSFNPKGKRGYFYIGHTSWYKNTEELERIAAMMPGYKFAHIGIGEIKGWKKISEFASLTPEFMGRIAEEYDIFVNVSTGDPQATTILEQMCFGFPVACTPESGYDHPSLISLHTTDTARNVSVLQALQECDESELQKMARENREIAITHHNWDRFTKIILDFMNIKV